MKRILIFSTAYHPYIGGAEIAVNELTERLGAEFEFDLITARMSAGLPKVDKVGNVTVYRIGFGFSSVDKALLPVFGALKAVSMHRKNNYDFFWCIMVTFASGGAYIANLIFSLIGKRRVPIVLTLQEGDSEEHLKKSRFGLIDVSWKLALNRTQIVTAISSYLLNRARENGFRGMGVLIPNGVDVKNFSREFSAEELNLLKQKLHKKENDVFLVTTSRLVKKNAVDDIIKSLQFLPESIKLVVIGTGDERRTLEILSRDLDLESRVKFLGEIEHGEIVKYLKISDIFIRPSLSEGFGNSFVEAMASGIPVLATKVGGIPDFLRDPDSDSDNPTGIFVALRDPRDIAKQVIRLLQNPALREQIVVSAQRMVGEKYDWNIVANQMKEVFK